MTQPPYPAESQVHGADSGRADTRQKARPPVIFEVAPLSRLWVALCLGSGGSFLAFAVLRGLGAVVTAWHQPAVEALFLP